MKNMRKYLATAITVATVVVVAVFLTSWVNILVPTFWKQEVLDAKLIFGWSVRSIITFLIILLPCILFKNRIHKHAGDIWLAMCLSFWIGIVRFSTLYLSIESSSAWLEAESSIYLSTVILSLGIFLEFLLLMSFRKEKTSHYLLMDSLFSIALAVLLYGLTWFFEQPLFGANSYGGIFPAVGLLQLYLVNRYHRQPKS